MKLGNPYDIFTEKEKKSLRFKLTNLIVNIQCWFIKKFKFKKGATIMQKQDMSATCGFRDVELYYKRQNREITQEEYDEYYNKYCSKCQHMVEICMYGEGEYE